MQVFGDRLGAGTHAQLGVEPLDARVDRALAATEVPSGSAPEATASGCRERRAPAPLDLDRETGRFIRPAAPIPLGWA